MNNDINDSQKSINISDLKLDQKVDVVKKSLTEMYNGLQLIEVRGHANIQVFIKALNTILDLDKIIDMIAEEIMNLEVSKIGKEETLEKKG